VLRLYSKSKEGRTKNQKNGSLQSFVANKSIQKTLPQNKREIKRIIYSNANLIMPRKYKYKERKKNKSPIISLWSFLLFPREQLQCRSKKIFHEENCSLLLSFLSFVQTCSKVTPCTIPTHLSKELSPIDHYAHHFLRRKRYFCHLLFRSTRHLLCRDTFMVLFKKTVGTYFGIFRCTLTC